MKESKEEGSSLDKRIKCLKFFWLLTLRWKKKQDVYVLMELIDLREKQEMMQERGENCRKWSYE